MMRKNEEDHDDDDDVNDVTAKKTSLLQAAVHSRVPKRRRSYERTAMSRVK